MGVYLATRCLPNESHSVFGSENGMATQMAERSAQRAADDYAVMIDPRNFHRHSITARSALSDFCHLM